MNKKQMHNQIKSIMNLWRKAETHRAVIFLSTFIMLSFLLSTSFVDAIPNEQGNFIFSNSNYLPLKQNTQFNLSILSDNSTGCNLTYIQYPDGSLKTFNMELKKSATTFYIPIGATNFSQLGPTCMGIMCFSQNTTQSGSVCRDITTIGISNNNNVTYIFLIIISLTFILGFIFKNEYIIFLASILTLLFGFFIIKFGIGEFKDVQTTYAIGFIVWAIGIYCLFLSTQEMLKQWN